MSELKRRWRPEPMYGGIVIQLYNKAGIEVSGTFIPCNELRAMQEALAVKTRNNPAMTEHEKVWIVYTDEPAGANIVGVYASEEMALAERDRLRDLPGPWTQAVEREVLP